MHWSFLQICLGYFNKNKESITVRNAISQLFIHGYPELIQSDNGKEFINKTLNAYLEGIDVKHLYGSLYHPQNQGAIETFNKKVQKSLSAAYDNERTRNWIGI